MTARGELGVIEGPKDNETKYGAYTKANFLPWCGSFVNWCANEVGLKIPNVVSTYKGAEAFIKKGQWEKVDEATPLPGDIVFFDFPNDNLSRISHVGIVVKDNGDGTVTCIEGNTSLIRRATSVMVVRYARRYVHISLRMVQRLRSPCQFILLALASQSLSPKEDTCSIRIKQSRLVYHTYVQREPQRLPFTWQVSMTLRYWHQRSLLV